MSKLPTVEETKIQVASEYGSKDYERDYEYGLGISKLMDPFEFMEHVCESHTAAHTAALRERVKDLKAKNDLFEKYFMAEIEYLGSIDRTEHGNGWLNALINIKEHWEALK